MDTLPEWIVRRTVHAMGFRYRLHVANLPGKPDLVFASRKKIVEVRGCFWHRHKGCVDSHVPKTRRDYWLPKLNGNRKRDRQNEKKLVALGWDVMTVWDCETIDRPALAERLSRFLNDASNPAPR